MSESPPNVQAPTPEEIRVYADQHHIELSDAEVEDFEAVIAETLIGYERLDELPDYRPQVAYTDRDPDTDRAPTRILSTPSSRSVR